MVGIGGPCNGDQNNDGRRDSDGKCIVLPEFGGCNKDGGDKPRPIVIHVDVHRNTKTNNIVKITQFNTAIAINNQMFPLTDFHFFADGTFLPICGTVEDKLIGGNCWDSVKQKIVTS